jgi:hypothetical protein
VFGVPDVSDVSGISGVSSDTLTGGGLEVGRSSGNEELGPRPSMRFPVDTVPSIAVG